MSTVLEERSEACSMDDLSNNAAKELVQWFKLFSDETRLRVLHFLMQTDELNVRELCRLLGQSQPAVSHHLALLRAAGLIECRRDGKHNFYKLISHHLQQFVERFFSSQPNQPGRIAFETFSLSYTPHTAAAIAQPPGS